MKTEMTMTIRTDKVAELERQLQNHLGYRIRDLHVKLRGDALVLQGCTHTYYMKQQAQHALMNLTDLPIFANEIKVV